MTRKCSHGEVKLLGEQKGEKGLNRYYKCLKCGSVLILSEVRNFIRSAKEKLKSEHTLNVVFDLREN